MVIIKKVLSFLIPIISVCLVLIWFFSYELLFLISIINSMYIFLRILFTGFIIIITLMSIYSLIKQDISPDKCRDFGTFLIIGVIAWFLFIYIFIFFVYIFPELIQTTIIVIAGLVLIISGVLLNKRKYWNILWLILATIFSFYIFFLNLTYPTNDIYKFNLISVLPLISGILLATWSFVLASTYHYDIKKPQL